MLFTGTFVVAWLAVGGLLDGYLAYYEHYPTVTDWFRWLAHRYPVVPGVVAALFTFAWCHLFIEDWYFRR